MKSRMSNSKAPAFQPLNERAAAADEPITWHRTFAASRRQPTSQNGSAYPSVYITFQTVAEVRRREFCIRGNGRASIIMCLILCEGHGGPGSNSFLHSRGGERGSLSGYCIPGSLFPLNGQACPNLYLYLARETEISRSPEWEEEARAVVILSPRKARASSLFFYSPISDLIPESWSKAGWDCWEKDLVA